jgi:hypothetical protein
MNPLDDPEYRRMLRDLVPWLADGSEVERREKLKAEILAKPLLQVPD